MSGIYIHIPFCKKACSYCNFHFSTTFSKYRTQLINALVEEIELRKNYLDSQEIESIYFGGGTPSLLNEKELIYLFDKLNSLFSFDKDKIEITLEANPDDLDLNKLRILKKVGINRLSIGVQSFHDEDLLLMNRSHDSNQAYSAIENSKKLGFENISIDLIFALPNSNLEKWQKNLEIAKDLGIEHLSIYNLTIEPKTKLTYDIKNKNVKIIDDKLSSEQFYMAKTYLEKSGYEHYEISNYAKRGSIAKHNTNYWLNKPYIGIGPGAHSFNGEERQWNISNNIKYISSINKKIVPFEIEKLSKRDQYNEFIITGLRTKWGCSNDIVEKQDTSIKDHFKREINKQIILNNIKFENGNYTITEKSQIISDFIISELMLL